jgi:hypothetical protein
MLTKRWDLVQLLRVVILHQSKAYGTLPAYDDTTNDLYLLHLPCVRPLPLMCILL